jgi:hypothetical protein
MLALLIIGAYGSFLFFIIKMTYGIMTSDKDKLLQTHYKTKFKNWLFIVEPLVELKPNNTEMEQTTNKTMEKDLDDSQKIDLNQSSKTVQ